VSFVDFAPSVLSLADVPVPKHMQGVAFLGPAAGSPREFVFGARDRVDEAIDTARSVRDGRWLYIHNYRPHLPWAQPEGYSDQSDFRRELVQLAHEGKLGAAPMSFFAPRAREELFDTHADPHQLHNLAGEPRHRAVLEKMRARLGDWLRDTRDLAFLPESDELARAGALTPFAMARKPGTYPFDRVLAAAELVGRREAVPQLRALLKDRDAGVRYWAAVGLRAAGKAAGAARADLLRSLKDASSSVRIEAAGALAALGETRESLPVLERELRSDNWNDLVHVARTLELLGEAAKPLHTTMRERLAYARAEEGRQVLAMFVRFALEAALR
jgi:hypothetical protein